VSACWRDLQIEDIRLQLLQARSAIVFVRAVLNLKEDICLKAAVLLWKTWDARNKSNAGERRPSRQEVRGDILCMVTEIQEGAEKGTQHQSHALSASRAGSR
jgi:hypothetical protein